MYVFINSSDKTSNVETNSITITDELQERINSADFSLSGFKPNDLDDVKIYEGFPIVNSSINSVSLKKYYWETIQNNIFRIGDIVDVNAPNKVEGTVIAIESEGQDFTIANLAGEWNFNGNANDSSGNGYNGTVSGATLTTNQLGHSNSAYLFDGVNDYISIGDVMDIGLSDFSYAVWFKTSSVGALTGVFGKSKAGVGAGRWSFLFESGILYSLLSLSTTTRNVAISQTPYIDGTWHLFTATMNRTGNHTLYIDGINKGSVSISADSAVDSQSTFPLGIGAYQNSTGTAFTQGFFNGKIDDVKIFQKELTQEEVTKLYDNGRGAFYNGNTKLTFSENFTSIPTIGNIAGRKKFAGNIIEIQDSNNTLLSNVQFDVKALDYTRVFDKKLLNDSYEDKDARYIINDFCNTTINLNQELDEFEYANNTALQASWIESGTGGNPTLDTSNYREGTQSASLPWTGSGTGTFTGTISAVNISMFTGVSSGTPAKGRIGFWYKTADYTKITSVTFRIGSDSSNYISSTFTPTSNDFTFYDFLLTEGTKVGTPVWTAIDYIAFVIVETATSSINIDGIRILENDFFRHYPYVQESVILADFRINRVKPTEIMQRLADSLAWYWFVDYDKYIHLFSETTKIAPIEITQTSNNFSNLTISADTSRLVNRQVIRADDETSTSTYSQVIQGDGIIREWLMKTSFKGLTVKLNDGTSTDTMEATTTSTTVKATSHGLITGDYIVNRTRSNAVREITYVDANTFTVTAVTGQTSGDSFSLFVSQTVGIEGLDVETSYDYVSNYTEKSIRASSSEPTLIAGQFLLFSYNEVIPILVQRTDNVSIALMKSTLGYTDGIFDGQPITDKTIKTRSEASKMAESIINKYSNVIITAQFATNQEGLESGQIITIQDSGVTERNINQSFVIQSVRSRQLAWGENRYSVTCSSLLFGMLELLQQILASRRKVNVDENEAINNIENANETLTITDSTLVNSNQNIEMETITISDTTVSNVVLPPFVYGDTGGGPQEGRYNLSVWG